MEKLFSPREAARLTGVPLTSINNYLQRVRDIITVRVGNFRPRFDVRGLRILALMAELTGHGVGPNIAAAWAATIVDRAKEWPLVAVFSRDPQVSPCLIPEDAMPATDALIMISLGPIWSRIEAGLKAIGR